MGLQRVIDVVLETSEAEKNVEDLTVALSELDQETDEYLEVLKKLEDAEKSLAEQRSGLKKATDAYNKSVLEANKNNEKLDKSTKKGAKGFGKVKLAVQGVGLALKAAGIGLIIAVFAKFTELLLSNQKALNFVNTAMTSVTIVFTDFIKFINSNFMPAVNGVKDFFDNLTFDNVSEAIKANLIERFESLLSVFGSLYEAFKSFVEFDFSGVADNLSDAGAEAIDVLTGVDNTVGKISETVDEVIEKTKAYGEEVVTQAENIVKGNDAATLSLARQSRKYEELEVVAEKLRQKRDDETLSLKDRESASVSLNSVLSEQEKIGNSIADNHVLLAQNQLELANNTENRIALEEALAQRSEQANKVETSRSEQQASHNAIIRDSLSLISSQSEAEAQLTIEKARFNAEQIEDDVLRLEALRDVLEAEKKLELDRLETKKSGYSKGTQDYVDAEIEISQKREELRQEEFLLTAEYNEALLQQEKDKEAKITEAKRIETEARIAIEKSYVQTLSGLSNLIGQFADKSKALQAAALIGDSAAGIAKIVIDTQSANAAVVAKYALIPGGAALAAAETTLNRVNAGIGIATNIAATSKALSKLKKGGAGSTGTSLGSSGAGGTGGEPQYNIVGNTQATTGAIQATTDAVETQTSTPQRAYVLYQDLEESLDTGSFNEEESSLG